MVGFLLPAILTVNTIYERLTINTIDK